MKHTIPARMSAFVSVVLVAGLAQAGSVGYDATFFGSNNNIPRIRLSNASDTASIVEFVLTLQRDAFQFDYARILDSSDDVGASLVDPEDLQGGHRAAKVEYSFDGFEPGETFTFKTDVDPTDANKRVDYREALLDFGSGDASDNVTLRVRFSDGTNLSGTWPSFDPNSDGSVDFGQTRTTPSEPPPPPPTVIPLPQGFWTGLTLLTIAGLGTGLRRRARRFT